VRGVKRITQNVGGSAYNEGDIRGGQVRQGSGGGGTSSTGEKERDSIVRRRWDRYRNWNERGGGRKVREKGAGRLEGEHALVGQLRELHDCQAVTGVALALHAPAAAGRHHELAFGAAHGRVALDVARAGAD
jgi:hypothetical protein